MMAITLRLALRALRRRRTTTTLLWLVLGLGTGIPAAVLAAVAVVERPVGAAQAATVFRLFGVTPASAALNMSPPDFYDLRSEATRIQGLAAMSAFAPEFTLTGRGDPRLVKSRRVTAGFLQTLGVPLLAGREFQEAEEVPPARPVLIGEPFWRDVLGASPDAVGQTLTLNGRPFDIVGVVAVHQEVLGEADIWLPVQFPSREIRGLRLLTAIGRVASEAELGPATAELSALASNLRARYPATNAQSDVKVVRLDESISGPLRRPIRIIAVCALLLWGLTGSVAVAYVLAIALQSREELAVTRAIGAAAWQLWMTAAGPHIVLVSITVPLALATAGWTLAITEATGLLALPRAASAGLAGAIAVTLLLIVFAGMLAAVRLVPVRERPDSRRGSSRSPGRAQRVVVAAQAACSVVLVAIAAVLTWAIATANARDIGFNPENRLFARLTLPSAGTSSVNARWEGIADASRSLAGVAEVGFTSELPHSGQDNPAPFTITSPEGRRVVAGVRAVTPAYLTMAALSLRTGRSLNEDDDERRPRVTVINRRLALELFGTEDVLGRVLAVDVSQPPLTAEIVGVMSDIRHHSVWSDPAPEAYFPVRQVALPALTLVLDSALPPASLQSTFTQAVRQVEPDMAVPLLTRWTDAVSARIAPHERRAEYAALLALFAVLLVGVSLYAFMTQTLEGRRQEFAIKVALGCPPERARRDMHVCAIKLTLAGAVPGAIAALPAANMAANMTSPLAPSAVSLFAACAVAVLAAVAVMAGWRPARQIAMLDAASSLRG